MPLNNYLLRVIFPFCFLTLGLFANNDTAKEFYLIDNLDVKKLSKSDRQLLDSSLSIYHGTENDSIKIAAIDYICENLADLQWKKYQYLQLNLIREVFKSKTYRISDNYLNGFLATALNNIGLIYKLDGHFKRALRFFWKALEIRRVHGSNEQVIETLDNMATALSDIGHVTEALNALYLATLISERIEDNEQKVELFTTVCTIYIRNLDYNKALDYAQRALIISEKINYVRGISNSLNNLGATYSRLGDSSTALDYYKRSLELRKRLGGNKSIATILSNMGTSNAILGNLEVGLAYCFRALEVSKRENIKDQQANALIEIGSILMKQKKFQEAQIYLEEGYMLAKEYGSLVFTKRGAELLSRFYELKGKKDLAFDKYKEAMSLANLINPQEVYRLAALREHKYMLEKKEHRIALLNKEKQLKEVQLRFSILIYSVASVLLVVLGIYWIGAKTRKFEQELNRLRELKSEQELKDSEETMTSLPVNVGDKIISFKLDDVVCFKVQSRYTFLINQKSKSYIVDHTLASLEESLPENFVRVHRSTIINNNHIQELRRATKGKVVFVLDDENRTMIPSGLTYANDVRKIVKNFG